MSKLPSIGSSRIGRWMTLANLATAATALLVASFLLILFQFLALRRTLIEDIGVQARIISENSTAALLFNDSQASTETLAILDASPAIQAAGIFNLEGKQLASYRRDGAEPVQAPPLSLVEAGHEFRFDHVVLARRIDIDGRGIGYVVLRANLGQLYARLASYAGLTLMVALGSLAVAYLLVARMRRVVKSAEAHLHYLAHIDPVTGLPNRHAFNERRSSALAEVNQSGGSIGLLLLDLDNFKIVNDTLGHHSGDLLLWWRNACLNACGAAMSFAVSAVTSSRSFSTSPPEATALRWRKKSLRRWQRLSTWM
ncbi:CHASE sensor domain-containing protein [Noviherbaspirillum sp.]|uniref:CHASE sensor domain-containing protein n=1 Tax=Noviherbaspirillum sp. TaxID=1926288 RepID=UPI002B4688A4|nr:CHASE sensor domain-containing protein [Noviherbaspirillum sp.]HJV81269.1 CHASE sensor domain-containing protein [Noviherbaspirillum sp.]